MGRRIGEIRADNGYTQLQLAEQAGVSIQMVQHWESGKNVTLKILYHLSKQLEHPIHGFFKDPKSLVAQWGRPKNNNGKKRD